MKIIRDAVCTACGCMCNDIELHVEDDHVFEARRACTIGEDWFQIESAGDCEPCLIKGEEATFDKAIAEAASILKAARYPLVYGLRQGTTESQRLTVEIAEQIGGVIDIPTSLRGAISATFRGVGEVTCTLGEVRHRSDLIIFWHGSPEIAPRHAELYSLDAVCEFVPQGRAGRTIVSIAHESRFRAEWADIELTIRPHSGFEVLWVLRALTAGISVDAGEAERVTGVKLAIWHDLIQRIKAAQHVAIFFGSWPVQPDCQEIEALQALVTDLNRDTRVVCRSLGGYGNLNGAEQVLTWTTGYPHSIDLARGYPRYSPDEYSGRELLARHEIDAALIVGSDAMAEWGIVFTATEQLQNLPVIRIDPHHAYPYPQNDTAVTFRTSVPGIEHGGTVYRVDGVPLPLRPFRTSHLPSEAEVLAKLLQALKSG